MGYIHGQFVIKMKVIMWCVSVSDVFKSEIETGNETKRKVVHWEQGNTLWRRLLAWIGEINRFIRGFV